MADLTITPADVALVRAWQKLTGPAGEAIDAGEVVAQDPTTGRFVLADASTGANNRALGVAVNSAVVGEAVTIVKQGLVDLGDALDSEAIDEAMELSNTPGKIDDAGGGDVAVVVGRVHMVFGSTGGDRLLLVEL